MPMLQQPGKNHAKKQPRRQVKTTPIQEDIIIGAIVIIIIMTKDIEDTQLYRVMAFLSTSQDGGYTLEEMSKALDYPIPSLRRIISDMKRVGKINKRILYGLKQ